MKKFLVLSLIFCSLFISKLGTAGSGSVNATNGGYDSQTFYMSPIFGLSISFYATVPSVSGYAAYITASWDTNDPNGGGMWYGYLSGSTSPYPSSVYDYQAKDGYLYLTAYTSGSGTQASAYANW